MRMVARSPKIARCPYGCCDSYRVKPRDRQIGKHLVKRKEDRDWRKDFDEEAKEDG